ncbi:hypothetical protein R3W88_002625 [Solanum pinnatisectum]|uniref:Diacylglycerol O-acyltransferase n=1 Tax=Solanum pinnatisectum TaxID=50273 RepID=A0AAV9MMP9_9SOLN|nr:hypothetical protein R3W88_002625 [Solanum pinnatisectum]
MESIRLLKPFETKPKPIEEEEGEPLSPSAKSLHEPNFNVHILSIMPSKSRINPQAIKHQWVANFIYHPCFCSLLVVDEKNNGEMKWMRTKVDIDKHVVLVQMDEQDLHESPDKFVENYIQNLSKQGIAVLRMHHSLGDGTSLISLLLACTRQTAHPDKLPTIPGIKKRASNLEHYDQYSTKGLRRYFAKIWYYMRLSWNTIVDFIATTMFLKDTNTPIKGKPGSELNPWRFVYKVVSLDDMKLVKNVLNMTINDVALGVTQAGLSVYLNRRFSKCKKDKGATEKNNNLPNNIRLRSSLLANLRPTAGMQALCDLMDNNSTEAKWGNMVGFVLLPFKIALRDDPLDYIKEAKITSFRKKNSLEAMYTVYISKFILELFGTKSNLVGPQEEISFGGHPMVYPAPTSYGQPQALMINFQSYINKMTVIVSVDENVIPDPHQLLDDLEQISKDYQGCYDRKRTLSGTEKCLTTYNVSLLPFFSY